MTRVLLFGFLSRMRQALEADHVVAVASPATRSLSIRESMQVGRVWGVGHTLTLLLFGSVVLVAGNGERSSPG
jgi:high-affinity nickel permease